MTTGEKIKQARKQCGLSQKQLSEKIGVSRSAVAKWESDKGMPDIDNLQNMARLFNVSVDYLLNEDSAGFASVTRESIDLSVYGKGRKKDIKDRMIKERFPDAVIFPLIGELKTTKAERVIDNIIGFFTDAPYGVPQMINSFKNIDKEFYLADQGDKQYLVMITNEFMEIRYLASRIEDEKFEIGDWKYIRCAALK